MGKESKVPLNVRESIKRLGNPYAWTQIEGFDDAVADGSPARQKRQTTLQLGPSTAQQDLFAQLSKPILPAAASGNPYASLAADEDCELTPASRTATAPPGPCTPEATTRAEFEGACRRLFAQYIPALERGRLRPEHRDFIDRNKSRSATIRFRLLQALQKYDLTEVVGLRPQFNRERESLTIEKLREIEQSVGEDE